MKRKVHLSTVASTLLLCTACLFACKKSEVRAPSSFTMYVVNAGINSKIQTNFLNNGVVAQNSRGMFFVESGQRIIIADTTALGAPILDKNYDFNRGIYTLFIAGQSPLFEIVSKEEVDIPFIATDKIYSSTDSVVYVRFANFSPNSGSLRIKLSTATTNEVENLPYKELSTWRPFKATSTTTNYVIELRNPSNNALITSYTFTANASNRFKNVTLMIRGLQGTTSGTNTFGVTPINYF